MAGHVLLDGRLLQGGLAEPPFGVDHVRAEECDVVAEACVRQGAQRPGEAVAEAPHPTAQQDQVDVLAAHQRSGRLEAPGHDRALPCAAQQVRQCQARAARVDEYGPGALADEFGGSRGADNVTGGALADELDGRAGNDVLAGGAGDDWLYDGDGNDQLTGGDGNDGFVRTDADADGIDRFVGGAGTDTVFFNIVSELSVKVDLADSSQNGGLARGLVLEGIEQVVGSDRDDALYGSAGNDVFWGNRGDDRLEGRAGDDALVGGAGGDLLVGGAGRDDFVYGGDATGSGDLIADFTRGQDHLVIDRAGFGLGADTPLSLVVGTAPVASGTAGQFLFETGTGRLWFDADGERLRGMSGVPGTDSIGAMRQILSTGHDYSWFILTQTIIEKEFALSGSEQNPDLTAATSAIS